MFNEKNIFQTGVNVMNTVLGDLRKIFGKQIRVFLENQ
jgi:hypothetical protein